MRTGCPAALSSTKKSLWADHAGFATRSSPPVPLSPPYQHRQRHHCHHWMCRRHTAGTPTPKPDHLHRLHRGTDIQPAFTSICTRRTPSTPPMHGQTCNSPGSGHVNGGVLQHKPVKSRRCLARNRIIFTPKLVRILWRRRPLPPHTRLTAEAVVRFKDDGLSLSAIMSRSLRRAAL